MSKIPGKIDIEAKYTVEYLKRIYNVKVIKVTEEEIIIETEMLYLQCVMTELYTSGYTEFHTTIVDSKHVQIRTEEAN